MTSKPMKSSAAFHRIILLFFLAFGSYCFGQNYLYSPASPTFNTTLPVELGYINMANGNLHLEIPLSGSAQRGHLKLGERIVYDSRIWQIFNNGTSNSFQPINIPNSWGGWRFLSGAESGAANYGSSLQWCDWWDVDGHHFDSQRDKVVATLASKLCTSGDYACYAKIDSEVTVNTTIGTNGLQGGNYNFLLGPDILVDLSSCFDRRCGAFPSLHFAYIDTVHLDTGNPFSFVPVGALVHFVVDLVGGNTVFSNGIPR